MFWHPVLTFVDLWPNLSRKVPLRVLLRYYFSDSTFHAEQNDMRQGYVRTTNNKVITLTLIWPLLPHKSDRGSDHTVRRGLLQWFFDINDLYLAPGKVSQFVHILNDWSTLAQDYKRVKRFNNFWKWIPEAYLLGKKDWRWASKLDWEIK